MSKKKYRLNPERGYWLNNELVTSKAYQDLNKSSFNLLWCLINECRPKRIPGKHLIYTKIEVSLSETHYIELWNTSKQTYINARNQLIRNGLIQQTYTGGNFKGDCNRYKVLVLKNTTKMWKLDKRWKRYPKENWEHEIPHRKKQLIGVDTRFKQKEKKKEKKTDYTLTEITPLSKILPKILDPENH